MLLQSINPFNNQVIKEFPEYSVGTVTSLIQKSSNAFDGWKRTGFGERSLLLKRVSRLLIENCIEYAGSITIEMGKPVTESLAEVRKCAWVCDYYADNGEGFLKPETVQSDADESYVFYEPLGTILGIMPWNFPFWQVFRFAVPALMAGNTVLLKHSSNVQISAGNIEKIFTQAGFPEGVFQNLVIGSWRVKDIIEDDIIKAVSLTGSSPAGQDVAAIAGNKLKKVLLELGGSNAFVVLGDADVEEAVNVGIKARMMNGGQSCIAAKRFILHRDISNRFIGLFSEKISKIISGDPLEPNTDMGPLASIKQAKEVEKQVELSVRMGARIVTGGKRKNSFFSPTLMTGVKPGMPVFDEEVFGPVAPVIIAENTGEAVSLANKTKFGLGVTLFTGNIERAKTLIPSFPDGAVFVNELVKSDPRLPFGGTKKSGFGRELSVHGIREFVNLKTVYIKNGNVS
jgi:succinate-semialdehyde dehydrogenase / glutarate-semialdehyde dehydrogenase